MKGISRAFILVCITISIICLSGISQTVTATTPGQLELARNLGSSNQKVNEPTLISASTGVNYQPLRDALAARNFREADSATLFLMQQAADTDFLAGEDADNFPCEDLRIIDQLWLNYSNGKFGFSIQQEIYQNLDGTREYNPGIFLFLVASLGGK